MRFTATILIIMACCSLYLQPRSATANEQPLTQRDWIVNLVDTLGYNFGLSDTPQDSDYIKLLEGTRTYRFEAEDSRNLADLVAINNFNSYGEFSGSGWVSSLSSPTMVRLNFLLPQTGTFHFYASVRLPGHTMILEGQTWQINENNLKFQRIDLGEITLNAGTKELAVAMPANGSIDYIEFIASPLPSITPLAGWELGNSLTYDDLAVTIIRGLDLQAYLPLQGEKKLIEAEANSTQRSFITDQRHLGEPHGGSWLRAGASAEEISLRFTVDKGVVYTFDLTAEGKTRLMGTLDDRQLWSQEFPPYLKEETIGTWFLTPGQHELKIELPARGGIDLLTLSERRSTGADFRILAGLPAHAGIETSDVNRLLTLLARLHNQD